MLASGAFGQPSVPLSASIKNQKDMPTASPKMKVEIWSDIMCPFCYIGKRRYEAALLLFRDARHTELEWHSFQLDPDISNERDGGRSVYAYLAERKGISLQESEQLHDQVTEMARASGLTYNFDKAVVANSFDAHRLIQLAKTKGLGSQAEEYLFRAYFTEGRNFADHEVLRQLGVDIGLDPGEVDRVLTTDIFADAVRRDIREAAQIGIQGVPFFVFNRKYAVSGAQPVQVFLETLEKAFADWRKEHPGPLLEVTGGEGATCKPDGSCD